jgi:uncharacterized protein
MNAVFLDTVGLVALWDTSDQWHTAAESAFASLEQSRAVLTTTSFVLLECANTAARRSYRLAVDRLRQRLESRGRIIYPTPDDWSQAWTAYREGTCADAGVVDCVTIAVMRRLGINRIFGNDKHFHIAGFETLF